MAKANITGTPLTNVELITTSDDAGYKWVEIDIDLNDPDAARLIGEAVIAKIRWTEEWANLRQADTDEYAQSDEAKAQAAKDTKRIAAKGHDCFSDANEVIHMEGESIWTTCAICNDTISVS